MKTSLARLLITSALALSVHATFAADAGPAAAPDQLAPVRAQIAAKQWQAAIGELKRINDPGNADWNNLMGYSLRKAKTPDYEAAEKFYNEALRINPTHRGALAYSGELYLTKGDVATAEKRLGTLDKACFLPCDEYSSLKKAVQQFKAAGNKYESSSY